MDITAIILLLTWFIIVVALYLGIFFGGED